MKQFFKQFYSIIDIENFLNDYFEFYKRVYEMDYFYQDYFTAQKKMKKYLEKRKLSMHQFSVFQQDLITLGFLNGFKVKMLNYYINKDFDDHTMEKRYYSVLNYENYNLD